jgi:hypothetical protein
MLDRLTNLLRSARQPKPACYEPFSKGNFVEQADMRLARAQLKEERIRNEMEKLKEELAQAIVEVWRAREAVKKIERLNP